MAQIRVRLTQILNYDQDVEIPDPEWEKIKRMSEEDAADELANYLDLDDPQDWSTEDDFEAENIDNEEDYYGKE